MADIQSISLRNFKGAEAVTIDLSKRINSPVITLIGLNESGKTTILEGLSYFVTGDNAVSSLFAGVHAKSNIAGLIPVHRKAAFSDEIIISGVVTLDAADYTAAAAIARQHSLTLDQSAFPSQFTITRSYRFEDSVFVEAENRWGLALDVRSRKGGKLRRYERPKEEGKPDFWLEVVNAIEQKLPRIAYFPTFLVDMPARIYLKEHKDERPVNRYYREVFQDILNSLPGTERLSLDKHISKRIEDFKAADKTPNWFSLFLGATSKATIDSVFLKISSAVTKEVLGSWQRVFQRPISAKMISIDWNVDTQKEDLPYASFVISDGESRYSISERSLGFRWFFSFLLFTAFKQASHRSSLFVFDEPAANLHAKAQAELLTSFSRIAAGGHRIVYSTHSHHMINPRWLSGAYIVENTALNYDDSDDAFGLSAKPTNVKVTNYRNFLAQYPERTSYFQPVIEKLEYVTPEIIGAAPFVIVEGITDFYALRLAMLMTDTEYGFSIMPSVGSGASGPLISLLLGRGEKFVVLLDDDKSGRKEAKRYRDEWHLPSADVVTLRDLDEHLENMRLESLLSPETVQKIAAAAGPSGTPTKKQIGLYLAEKCAVGGEVGCLSGDTLIKLHLVLSRLNERIVK